MKLVRVAIGVVIFFAWIVGITLAILVGLGVWVIMRRDGSFRWQQFPTFNVHALIKPDCNAERSNTLYRKGFKIIYDTIDHDTYRWVIVSKDRATDFWAIDLWETTRIEKFPYVEPMFVSGGPYKTVEQAIGATILSGGLTNA